MEENLIKNIEDAEQKASEIIDSANKQKNETLKNQKKDFELMIEEMEKNFLLNKEEAVKDVKKNADLYKIKSNNSLENELIEIESKTTKNKKSTISFILNKLLEEG